MPKQYIFAMAAPRPARPVMVLENPRRKPVHPDISEDMVHQLVHAFYARIRDDASLGPIFARVIGEDWGPHLAKMCDFWSSVMLMSGRYKGNPVEIHRKLEGIEPPLFGRWLDLFGVTCGELFEDPIADAIHRKVQMIAESLKIAMFYRPDRPWPAAEHRRRPAPSP